MTPTSLPVDLAVPGGRPLQPTAWAVVWWADGIELVRWTTDRALAHAYAAAHRGVVVPHAALETWPKRPV